jgi:hypothetical protein
MKRAKTYDEVRPLIELCKGGRLFDVQAWIAAGKPVNPPEPLQTGHRKRSPLECAIDAGFHSLVQVLLEGGAAIEETDRYSTMKHALWDGQYEIAKLLVVHEADVKKVDMEDVFATWNTDLMEYFIDHGGDVETSNPIAHAFCQRIRTALKIYRRYEDRFPSFREQANIALRYHCKEGDLKWVSLMLWLGAEPYSKGPDEPSHAPDPDIDGTAFHAAALHGQDQVLGMKKMPLDVKHESCRDLLQTACIGRSAAVVKRLLALGFPANDLPTGGSSHVERILSGMHPWTFRGADTLDMEGPRAKLAMLQVLVQHGARWLPTDGREMNWIRRGLLSTPADQTLGVIRIMSANRACERRAIEALLKTPTMQAHMVKHMTEIEGLILRLPVKMGGLMETNGMGR